MSETAYQPEARETTFDAAQARAFLEALYSDCAGFIEIRPLDTNGDTVNDLRTFVPTIDLALEAIQRAAMEWVHVYTGVATRRTSVNGKKENLAWLRVFHVDFDCKSGDPDRFRETLAAFPMRPSLIIWSGGGMHVYWILREPIDVSDAENIALVDRILKALTAALGSDPAVAHAACVMRVPGCMNVKNTDGRIPTMAHIQEMNATALYTLEDFAGYAASEEPNRPRGRANGHDASGDRPGDAFNRTADWNQLLADRGFRLHYERSDYQQWTRPDKSSGPSVTVIHGLLWVFSSSIPQLQPNRSYDPFGFIAAWDHGGDFAAAARALADRGDRERVRTRLVHDDGEPERCTDLGNARRLVRHHGSDLRYCHPLEAWFAWDGRRWARDDRGEVERRAKLTVAAIYGEAAGCSDDRDRKELAAWALKSESRERIRNMIALACSEPGVSVMPEDFDRDPFLLNVDNGTINLHNAVLREHRRDDLITKVAPVVFDMHATSLRWLDFIEKALPDAETRRYAQKMAGRALLGRTGDDKAFVIHGITRTGKGTFQSAIEGTLGEYAATAGLSDFGERRRDVSGPRPELVKLRGARLVSIYETSARLRLSASTLKTICGSDPITVRDLYAKPITFTPSFTLLVATNHRPWLPDDDDAVWERIVEIPFQVQIPANERDITLRNELRDPKVSGPAVLNWMLSGCLLYQREGLEPPEAVTNATADYKAAMDPLNDFTDELLFAASNMIKAKDLRAAYETWCAHNDRKPVSAKRMAASLEARGCRKERPTIGGEQTRVWYGVRLADDASKDTKTPQDATCREF